MTQRRRFQSIGLLVTVVFSAVLLWALAAMVQTTPVVHADSPPQIETITITSTKQTYFYNQELGEEGGTVYFNNLAGEGAGQVITVTMNVTGSMPITLTGAPAFGYNPPPDTSNPWEITYTIGISAGTENGVPFTVTASNGLTNTAAITFTRDITDPTVEFTDVTPPDYDDGSNKWYDPDNLSAGWYFTSKVTDTLSGLALANAFWDHFTDHTDRSIDPSIDGTGVFTDVASDEDGTVTVTLTITDHAGNSASDTVVFNLDNTEPLIPSARIEDYGSPWLHVDNLTIYYGDEMPEPQSFRVEGESNDDTGVGLDHAEFSSAFGLPPPSDNPEPSAWAGRYWPDNWNWGNGTITVTIYDLVGNAAYQTFNYIRDTEPPTVVVTCLPTAPAPFWIVRWSGSDPAPASGVRHYDVQYKVGSDGPWQDWHTDTSLTQAIFGPDYPVSVKNGQTYYFRVRAEDNVSNVSPYTNGEDATTYHSGVKKVFLPVVMAPDPNWGFETGDFTNWQHDGQLARSVSTAMPHSGNYSALLGSPSYPCNNVPVGSAWLRRSITVPSSGSPTLSFYYRIFTQDKTAPEHYDKLDLFAVYINGSQLVVEYANITYPPTCAETYDLCPDWCYVSFSLDAYKGQTIQITFYNYNRADPPFNRPEMYNTYTYIDDVSVQ